MAAPVFSYQHSLPAPHYEQLCELPGVIARYSPGAEQTSVWRQIQSDIAGLPTDPATGNRILEVDPDDQRLILLMLDWATNRSGDERFEWLANQIREGADAVDSKMRSDSVYN